MNNEMELMKETIESANEYIQRVIDGIGGIVYNLQSGREEKALPLCSDLFEGLKWLIECANLTKPLQKDRGIIIDSEEINTILEDITKAFENKDYVLLADLLEYEFMPIISGWKTQFENILK